MSELKTKPSKRSVTKFINALEDEQKRKDSRQILRLMEKLTGSKPILWGENIIGFGRYHYTYKSGQEGSWFITGFSPRKQNLTIYIMPGFSKYDNLLKKLGKHKKGKSCLYINKLDNIDTQILEKLISESVEYMRKNYQCN